MERHAQLEEVNAAKLRLQSELEATREEYNALQVRLTTAPPAPLVPPVTNTSQAKYDGLRSVESPQRANSLTGQVRKSNSVASLPSPPPAIPLPPLPNGTNPGTTSPTQRPPRKDISGTSAAAAAAAAAANLSQMQIQEDHEARIRLIEKHLKAEKQLTATLEEALTDLERQQNTIRSDCDAWRRRASELESELKEIKEKPQQDNRWSLQQVEEERRKRRDAEIARAHLEERMNTIAKKKKKGSLNCF
jgi:kinesin family protein 4/21/27